MYTPKTTDDAVFSATGKRWEEWFNILDEAGAKTMKHIDIARMVNDSYLKKNSVNVATNTGWWAQMITVEYERSRGLRKIHQQQDGYMVSVHRTFAGPFGELQHKWDLILQSPEVKGKKLERIPSKTKRAMIRYKAVVGEVVVNFDKKDPNKSRIVVEAIKLPTQTSVEKERAFWKKVLDIYLPPSKK